MSGQAGWTKRTSPQKRTDLPLSGAKKDRGLLLVGRRLGSPPVTKTPSTNVRSCR